MWHARACAPRFARGRRDGRRAPASSAPRASPRPTAPSRRALVGGPTLYRRTVCALQPLLPRFFCLARRPAPQPKPRQPTCPPGGARTFRSPPLILLQPAQPLPQLPARLLAALQLLAQVPHPPVDGGQPALDFLPCLPSRAAGAWVEPPPSPSSTPASFVRQRSSDMPVNLAIWRCSSIVGKKNATPGGRSGLMHRPSVINSFITLRQVAGTKVLASSTRSVTIFIRCLWLFALDR